MGKMYGYTRVSTANQVEGASLAAQASIIDGLAQMRGRRIERMFEDPAVSGSRALFDRPAGKQLLEVLRAGDSVVFAKLDRGFRSVMDAAAVAQRLSEMGVDMYIANMGSDPIGKGAAGKLMFVMITAFAEFERETIAERFAEGRNAKRAKSGHIGGEPPFGYRVTGEGRDAYLVEVPEELAACEFIYRKRDEGFSYRDIAQMVEQEHPAVGEMSHQKVKRILDRRGQVLL